MSKLKEVSFNAKKIKNFQNIMGYEWQVTNGLGGFCSSTVVGLNTRRYHSLLTASLNPPLERRVMVNTIDETIFTNDKTFELAVHQYPGTLHPQGFNYLHSFKFLFYPIFTYKINSAIIEKSIWMEHGKNRTFIRYNFLKSEKEIFLKLSPTLNYRDYHSLQKSSYGLEQLCSFDVKENSFTVSPNNGEESYQVGWSSGSFREDRFWYYNNEYLEEQKRGLDFTEDTFNFGSIEATMKEGDSLTIVIASGENNIDFEFLDESADLALQSFCKNKEKLLTNSNVKIKDSFHARLTVSADDFLVDRKSTNSKTVIAGYPWFGDWGRDTMISLPGLTLSVGRTDDAKSLLETFARYLDGGMIPNLFPDAGTKPEYNTVDATLWFVVGIYKYYLASGDSDFIKKMFPKIEEVISSHIAGTRFGIKVDDDGLLTAGKDGVQLTWMDARIGDWVVTPRQGKAVEINALWINTLLIYKELSKKLLLKPSLKIKTAGIKKKFEEAFWNEDSSSLYDVISDDGKDSSIRPNQIFALSLPFSLLGKKKANLVLKCVEKNLLTPYGLRTLDENDKNYKPLYRGNPYERDSAYHQGTVWPWLIGHYLLAVLSVKGKSKKTQKEIDKILKSLSTHIEEAGLGHISEVFDASSPHTAGGCYAQAWSVATILEALSYNSNAFK